METNDNENTTAQNLLDTTKAVLRGKHSGTSLSQDTRKVSNTQPNPTPKGAGERTTKKA